MNFLRLIVLFQFFITFHIQAQTIKSKIDLFQIPEKPEFVSNVIRDIYQDSLGYLWYCKEDGVFRYDGFKYEHFVAKSSGKKGLSNSISSCIAEITNNRLLIGTKLGLNIYHRIDNSIDHIFLSDMTKDIQSDRIKCINVINNTKVLVGTDQGLFLIDDFDDLHEISIFSGKIGKVHQILNYSKNSCLVCTDSGFYLVSLGTKQINALHFTKNNIPFNESIKRVFLDNEQQLWLVSKTGLYISKPIHDLSAFNAVKIKSIQDVYPFIDVENQIQIKSFYQDSNQMIWIAVFGSGFYKINIPNGKCEHYSIYNSSLRTNFVTCFCEDFLGQIYIGTEAGANIFRHSANQFINYSKIPYKNKQAIYNLHEILKDKDNRLWVGSRGSGLTVIDSTKKQSWNFSYQTGHPIDTIRMILLDSKDKIWIGSGSGVYIYDYKETKNLEAFDRSNPFKRNIRLNNEYIYCAFEDRFSNVWIGTLSGLWFYERAKDTITKVTGNALGKFLYNEVVYFIEKDKQGRIWLGTLGGKLVYFEDLEPNYHQNPEFVKINQRYATTPAIYFIDLLNSTKGQIWLTTNIGLYQVDLEANTIIPAFKDNLFQINMFGILEDQYHTLWISSSKGLYRYDYEKNSVEHYLLKDGLPTLEYNGGAAFKDSLGNLYFGSRMGMLKIKPKPFYVAKHSPNNTIHLVGLSVNGNVIDPKIAPSVITKHISIADEIHLASSQRSIGIEISAFNHYYPSNNTFLCKMEGIDGNWIELQNTNSINYVNMPSGDYKFLYKIKGTNDYKSVAVNVDSYWYVRWWFISLLVLTILGVMYYIYIVRLKKINLEQKLQIANIEKEKSNEFYETKLRFFTNISHEIRTPLSLIISPIKNLLKNYQFNHEVIDRLKVAERNSHRLLHIVDELLDFRKIDQNKVQMKVSNYDIQSDLAEIFESFSYYALDKGINLKFEKTKSINLWYDRSMINKVVVNLVSNAINACKEGDVITISCFNDDTKFRFEQGESFLVLNPKQNKRFFYIKVTDSGFGMSKEMIEKAFDRFFVGAKSSGTGIGLFLVKRFIEFHSGLLAVNSKEGIGTIFTIGLPFGKEHYKESDLRGCYIAEESDSSHEYLLEKTTNSNLLVNKKCDEDKPLLLIVEDNVELRNFIELELSDNYRIKTASSGEEAWSGIQKDSPDIIISDVVMNEMSGFELCSNVKNTLDYCHIPVVLLTAKILDSDQVEGFTCGADAYVKKPFNIEILIANINSLLENRKTLKDHFNKIGTFNFESIKINDLDKDLLQKINKIIEENISNPGLLMDDYALELGLSRTQFYRKIKSLTGQTPNNFVKITRINVAHKLIKDTNLTIAEVAYKTGFTNPKYFSKCFKQQLGFLPSEVI
ncbi:response regulator [Marinifilum sp.]|uniref:hybrid sensor histidine kinase/response regulator transcription factor n=1 Tax=Marinifilum sp. TaxID=2033137 RepID=UPI003BAB2744